MTEIQAYENLANAIIIQAARDYKKAYKILEELVKVNYADSLELLGEFYYFDEKYDKALVTFKKAIKNKENVYSNYMLGLMYAYGLGVDVDYTLAIKYLEIAIKKGDHNAMQELAHLYFNGYGVQANIYKAYELWDKAAKLGNSYGYANLGIIYCNGYPSYPKDYKKAFDYFKKAADMGNEFGKAHMANCYLTGNGVTKDYYKAYQIVNKSELKNHFMLYVKGKMYYEGYGVAVNYDEAFKYFSRSIELSNKACKEALYYIGRCYYFGQGTNQDKDKAYEYMVLSKNLDYSLAENFIKEFYSK